MANANEKNHADLIEQLQLLEYAIRRSITVREDQDEPAELQHKEDVKRYGVDVEDDITKGDLLNAVQTLVRANQRKATP